MQATKETSKHIAFLWKKMSGSSLKTTCRSALCPSLSPSSQSLLLGLVLSSAHVMLAQDAGKDVLTLRHLLLWVECVARHDLQIETTTNRDSSGQKSRNLGAECQGLGCPRRFDRFLWKAPVQDMTSHKECPWHQQQHCLYSRSTSGFEFLLHVTVRLNWHV